MTKSVCGWLQSFPHTRGGGPLAAAAAITSIVFSPHAWGWTDPRTVLTAPLYVFPTRVGVDRDERQDIEWA